MSTHRLRASVVAGVILLSFAFILPVLSQTTPTEGVRLFNGRDGSGPSQDIPIGVFQVDGKQLAPGEGGKPNISVKVPAGVFIRFCEQKDGTGKCEEFGEGVHNLTTADFNFIRVWKGSPTPATPVAPTAGADTSPATTKVAPLVVFEQKHWLGRSQVFGPGMYRSFRGEFGRINDNQVRSVVISKGYRARFCSEEGLNFRGSGDCETHEEGRHNLRFANSISFVEVVDLSDTSDEEKLPVVLYEDTSQEGKMQGFDVGVSTASGGKFRKLGNDQATSIWVKDGYRATVCSDEPQAGATDGANCEEFGPGRKNLKNRKSASWVRVSKN